MCVSNTLEIDELCFLRFFARMNHLKAILMVSSERVVSKVLRMAIYLKIFDAKMQNGECNVRSF